MSDIITGILQMQKKKKHKRSVNVVMYKSPTGSLPLGQGVAQAIIILLSHEYGWPRTPLTLFEK